MDKEKQKIYCSENYFKGFQNVKLFYQIWSEEEVNIDFSVNSTAPQSSPSPQAPSKANFIITHGQGEHSECYMRLIEALGVQQWTFYGWDLRGHGRSEGARGYVGSFDEYCLDFELFIKTLIERHQIFNKPTYFLAHSMGGLIQLKTLIEHSEWPVQAQILSSPMMGVAVEIPKYKEIGAQLLYKIAPKITLWNELSNEHLTQDPLVLQEYERDVLRHNRISSAAYLDSLKVMEFIKARAYKIKVRTLLQIAENDPVVSSSMNRELFDLLTLKEKELKIYPRRRHEIYNDLGREEVFKDLINFLNKRDGGGITSD